MLKARISPAVLESFVKAHSKDGERLYAVVDAARDRTLALAARNLMGQPLRPLFDNAAPHMQFVGPYVTPIEDHPKRAEYLDLWCARLWDHAGLFVLSDAWPQAMRTHLRSIFLVRDEDDNEFYFRFYDPRVLRAFLPTCTGAEAKEFMGPIRRIIIEAEEPGKLIVVRADPGGFSMEGYQDLEQPGGVPDPGISKIQPQAPARAGARPRA